MKNLIKYASIAMIVIAALELPFEIYVVFRNGFSGPAQFTLSFINHVAMLIVGVMGLKFRDDDEKQKMLAGISGMQLILCLLAIFGDRVSISLWATLKNTDVIDWLSIICSVVLLVYYVQGMIKVKKKISQQDE